MKLHQVVVLASDAGENDRVTATCALCAHDATGAHELIRHAVDTSVPIGHLAPAWAVLARYGYEHEAATFLRDIVYDRARPPGDRIVAAIALADAGSWLGEAISAIHMILREPGLTAKDIIAAGEFLSEAGEWSQAIALLDTLDIQQLDEELARRLAKVPVRTLFHRDCTQQPTPVQETGLPVSVTAAVDTSSGHDR
jgi:hypothetical protein